MIIHCSANQHPAQASALDDELRSQNQLKPVFQVLKIINFQL